MTAPKKYRLALVGPDSLQAQEIKRVLLAQHFPAAGIEFYDPDVTEEYSKLTEFGDEPKIIRGLAGDSLEGKDLVFLAADRETDRKCGQLAAKLDFKAIDLVEAFNEAPDVPLVVAGVNDDLLKQRASEEPCSVSCISVTGRDEVFIGQVKKEEAFPRSFWLWSVADNLTRGSALNALDIARKLLRIDEVS